jgi:subtilisin family serine protease
LKLTRRRKTSIALLTAGLVITLGLGQPAGAAPSAGATGGIATAGTSGGAGVGGRTGTNGATSSARPATVTLLTGDRITVAGSDATRATVSPAKGREHIRFLTYRVRGDLYVIPQDAARLVQSGKLDRRLFDVTGLVRLGYDDAGRGTLPLIIGYRPGTARPSALAGNALTARGAQITRSLPAINGAALLAGKATAGALWPALVTGSGTTRADTAAGIDHIWLDGQRRILDDQSDQQIGAPVAWQAGYTGSGVTVAVLDGGIDATHPDLAGKVVGEHNFTDDPDPSDKVGHGTHVASIIAGTGAASGGQYKGVAPDAKLLDGKVCVDEGCDESAILAGMQWAAADEHAKVVNVSLGGGDSPDIDPLEAAVNDLTAQYGTLFVIAAGNDGPGDGTVGSPGSADAALTVGAVDATDQLADFSSVGPRVGDGAMKPDITAPGVDIIAARAAGTELGEPVGDSYVKLSGTSMATPHVTGSVALLAQQHPDWTAAQFKATLMGSAQPNPDLTGYQQGAGRVDLARAITQSVTSEPTSVSLGTQLWPHGDDQPVTRTVTYHNAGTAAVALNLAPRITGPGGVAAPAGMFTLSADQLTVPAGGQAQVTLTGDSRVTGPDGLYSGDLLATAGDTRISTPVGVNKEVESYTLTLTMIDPSGAPAANYSALLLGTDAANANLFDFLYDPSGTVTVRLPKGGYDFSATFFEGDTAENSKLYQLAQPVLNLTGDTHLTVDARVARPDVVTAPDPTARPVLAFVGYDHVWPNGSFSSGAIGDGFEGLFSARLGPKLPASQVVGDVASQWAKPDADGGITGTPYVYALSDYPAGGLPNGYERHYRKQDVASVRTDYRTAEPASVGMVLAFGISPLDLGGWSAGIEVPLPSTLTRYFSDTPWNTELDSGVPGPDDFPPPMDAILLGVGSYRPGHQYQERWNGGPFGPSAAAPTSSVDFVTRLGDTLIVDPALFSDGDGHAGYSLITSGSTTVYRDGVQIGQQPQPGGAFDVPAGTGRYRVEVQASRTGFDDLSSTVSTAWTFRSGHVNDTDFVRQPIMAVRFTPRLDADNRAPAGRFTIPVSVERQPGTGHPAVRTITVQVSYDDGGTWHPTTLRRTADGWTATVNQPSGGGFVSLRASATDSSGNTVEQTVIHAYALKAH